MSVFNKMFRKTSLEGDISTEYEKRVETETKNERPREHYGYRVQE